MTIKHILTPNSVIISVELYCNISINEKHYNKYHMNNT